MLAEQSAAPGLRFCAGLSLRRLADFFEFVAETTADRRCRSLASFLHGLAGALAARVIIAAAAAEAMLGKRCQSSSGRDREQLGDQWALEQLDEGVAGASARRVAAG